MESDRMLVEMHHNNLTLSTIQKLYRKSLRNKNISYIPYIVNMDHAIQKHLKCGASVQETNVILKEMNYKQIQQDESLISQETLQTMSTSEIITKADEMFNTKMTNEAAKIIFDELKTRNDIFDEILLFTGNNNEFKDDLYFWQPGLLICDIYTLLLQLYKPEHVILKYKAYLSKCIILNKEYYLGFLNLLNERYSSQHFMNIEVMKTDQVLFSHNTKPAQYKKIVSHEYWSDACCKCPNAYAKLRKEFALDDGQRTRDLRYEFCCCLSYVEVELGVRDRRVLTVPVFMLEDLYNGCVKYQSFWITEKIIDSSGNFTIE